MSFYLKDRETEKSTETEIHLLVQFLKDKQEPELTQAKTSSLELNLNLIDAWQELDHSNHCLLPPRVRMSRTLGSEVDLHLEAGR